MQLSKLSSQSLLQSFQVRTAFQEITAWLDLSSCSITEHPANVAPLQLDMNMPEGLLIFVVLHMEKLFVGLDYSQQG